METRPYSWTWSPKIDAAAEQYKTKTCECGCGQLLNPSRKGIRDSVCAGKPIRFKRGHWNRLPGANLKRGKNHHFYGKKGPLSPVWKGGLKKRADYGINWPTQRRKARKRDASTCQHCGTVKRRIDVHHIKPFKSFTDFREANDLSNLVCLCYKCHMLEEWKLRKNGVNSEKALMGNPEPAREISKGSLGVCDGQD